jgi:hypothetical protein
MIHEDHGLVIFIDMQPSEQLGPSDDCVGVLCGVFSGAIGIAGLTQYKNKPHTDRVSSSDEIGERMVGLQIRSIGCVASFGEIKRIGEKILNSMPKKVATKVATKKGVIFEFDNKKINHKTAVVLAWYAIALSVIAIKYSPLARFNKQSKMLLIIDNLPGCPSDSIKFLRRMNHHPKIVSELERCKKEFKVEFTYANMGYEKKEDEPDNHHGMIFADWLAHSLYISKNIVEYIDKPAIRNEDYKSKLASIWFKLEEAGRAEIIQVNGIL